MIAIILAVVVLGAVAAFFALKGNPSSTRNGSNDGSGSDQIALIGSGSGSSTNVIAETPIDAPAIATAGSNDAAQLTAECEADAPHWDNVKLCAEKLRTLDPTKAAELEKRAHDETGFDDKHAKMQAALGEGSIPKAKKLLAEIPDTSYYRKDAEKEVDAAEGKMADDYKSKAQKLAGAGKCKDIDQLITQAATQSAKVADAVRPFKCAPAIVAPTEDCSTALRNDTKECKKQFCAHNADSPKCPQTQVVPNACATADATIEQGVAAEGRGEHAAAVAMLESGYRCKKDSHTLALTFMAACNAVKPDVARKYWKLMSPDAQAHYLQMCLHNHITKDMLDGQ
jgi:hypothetical protein